MIHTVKGFRLVNEAEVDVFLEFSCFFYDPADVINLISGSSTFVKSSLYIWKFLSQILLKPSLKDFEHNLASMWSECNCMVVWNPLALPFFGIGMKVDILQSCGHCWVSQICWHIECSTLTESCFRIWNSSAGILTPSLARFVVMLPKVLLSSQSRKFCLGEWAHHYGYLSFKTFFFKKHTHTHKKKKKKNKNSSVHSCHCFLIYSASLGSLFLSFIVPIFAGNVPLVSWIFLGLFFSILSFFSLSLHFH